MPDHIVNGVIGVIAYKLSVEGELVEDITKDDALEYLHGAHNIVAGLEAALEGKSVGDRFLVEVSPQDGYGEYDEELIEEFPIDAFEDLDELFEGLELEIVTDDGDWMTGVVQEIREDVIVIDLNDPLAGQTLTYEVEVVGIREATAQETEQGYPMSFLEYMDEDEEDEEEDNHEHG
ncbi:peptidylprolyl isomerase [Anaerolineales bacterium]